MREINLARLFKKREGVTPKEYAQRALADDTAGRGSQPLSSQ